MALNYETLIRAAGKSPEQRTANEINDFIFPWLKQSLAKKQGIFQKISDGRQPTASSTFRRALVTDLIHEICRTVVLERRTAWDVVIRQNDPGET